MSLTHVAKPRRRRPRRSPHPAACGRLPFIPKALPSVPPTLATRAAPVADLRSLAIQGRRCADHLSHKSREDLQQLEVRVERIEALVTRAAAVAKRATLAELEAVVAETTELAVAHPSLQVRFIFSTHPPHLARSHP